jgi:hypothetical protein
MKESKICSIVALERFIEATRDAGYKNITSALAELIDNAFEANANTVKVSIEKSNDGEITVITSDDGCGMQPPVLQKALQFGGSTRFNSRLDSGRFGMGLPNSSLSQARRVEVVTWRKPTSVWHCYLDVDEIASGELKLVPEPKKTNYTPATTKSGTVVIWTKCDRIKIKNEKKFLIKIYQALGRIFRNYLWAGKEIVLCGEKVIPFDPLYLQGIDPDKSFPFGTKLEYEIAVPDSRKKKSTVSVQFVELPIEKWHRLSNEQKQAKSITKNAGVSIIRANREIDYGWFFTGKKRKENYDDWWRCEICFEPELDELFGVTNTKQGIRPTEYLKDILSPDIERIANTLNSRVRAQYAKVKAEPARSASEKIAAARDHLLEPPERAFTKSDNISLYGLQPTSEVNAKKANFIRGLRFRIEARKIAERSFYIPLLAAKELTVLLNENHPFYQCIFSPSMQLSNPDARLLHQYLELTLFAVARAECTVMPDDHQNIIKTMREEWSKVLATFLE